MSLSEEIAAQQPPPHVARPGWSTDTARAAREGWKVTVTADSAELETAGTETQIVAADDWDGVLRHFGLNPTEFQIVDDTVRMSSWQQSKRLESGDRDTITLYAYRARFQRVTDRLPAADVAAVLERVRKWKPIRRTPGNGLGEPATFYEGWADWQAGKSAGGGPEVLTQRVLQMFELTAARVKELRRVGRNVTALDVWNMGDPTEGCYGNYASQLFTVKMTRREQLNLVLDLWLTGLRTFAPMFDEVRFGSLLCNHGEWTRQGPSDKPVTSDSDNVGGFLADTLRTVLTDRPGFDHVEFAIPHDEMTMQTSMSGVTVALAHGHKMPGTPKELEWLRGQSIRLLRDHGTEPQLWMTAHRHHLDVRDFGPWTRLQHPSLDGGSKWYEDTTGAWATPGTLTCLIGQHDQAGDRHFSDLAVLL